MSPFSMNAGSSLPSWVIEALLAKVLLLEDQN